MKKFLLLLLLALSAILCYLSVYNPDESYSLPTDSTSNINIHTNDDIVESTSSSPFETEPQETETTSHIEHIYGEWNSVVAATCTTEGARKRFCLECGYTEQETTPALEHVMITIPAQAATCTVNGLLERTICSRCGFSDEEEIIISAYGHSYVFGVCENCSGKDPDYVMSFVVKYTATRISNNHVGNSWGYGIQYDGEEIGNKTTIKVNNWPKNIEITVFAVEYDKRNDYGARTICFPLMDVGEKVTETVTVTVRENAGRYSGNTAKWEFTVTCERTK